MPRGRKSLLSADKTEYLESVYPEWLEKRPHLTSFWAKVERGWFAKWPVEPGLNLPITTVSIEESDADGDAEEAVKGVIRNWINNKGQKEKKAINENNPAAAVSVPLRELFLALGRKGTRIKQRTELWTVRNRQSLRDALETENFASLMGISDDEETPEERGSGLKRGIRAVTQRLYEESPEEEKAVVEQIYLAQERKTKKKKGRKAETPEEFQLGLDQLGPVLKEFHAAVTDMTGWVGGTVLVGPVPKEGGKIGTQSHPRWGEQVVNPLQQFGKKVFDHKTRKERALELPEISEGVVAGGRADVVVELPRRKRKSTSPRTARGEGQRDSYGDCWRRQRLHLCRFPPYPWPGHRRFALIPYCISQRLFPNMNDDFDTTSPLETASFEADMTMIDPALRGNSLAPGEDALGAGNDEPRPHETLATPLFELRSMSADSPSHESLAPFTQGFQFHNGVKRTTPTGSPTVGGRIPGQPFGLFRLAQKTAESGTTNTSPNMSPSAPAPPARGAPVAPVTPAAPSAPAARGAPAAPAMPTTPPLPAARSLPTSLVPASSTTVTTPSPLRFVHTPETTTPSSGRMTSLMTLMGRPPAAPIPAAAVSSLTPDDFPESRPMSNAPPMPKPPGSRGRGGHTGAGTRGRGGQGGRGGNPGRAVREEDGDGIDQGMGMGDGTSNTVAPVSRERMKEIRAFEKKRDALAAQAAKERDHGIFRFGPPPAGHEALPQGPAALGARRIEVPIKLVSRAAPPPPRAPSARERRAPVRVPVRITDSGKENTTEGDGGKGKKKTGDGEKGKRKAHAQNVDVGAGGHPTKK
ncbi:hypothetical protein K438DRAFT_1772133 [Mycena galopus ATCC 62051]|nr:hypothetical protein K438DRAFT_1772133 [Mycena galopus ATCC 62051]